jgi:hypothetical protein
MIPPLDPFVRSFDSIEIERAPSPAAIESAFAALAPTAAIPEDGQPGFFLLDDANGRFIVDREMGVVMLRDETLLTREHGAVYPARLRVVEQSGASYDLDLKLRLTGRVPQVLGAEDFGLCEDGPPQHAPASPPPLVAWSVFSPVRGGQALSALHTQGAYGALLSAPLPAIDERVVIVFSEAAPLHAPAHAAWSI